MNATVGPFLGEFGWELMTWQAYWRWAAHNLYDEVYMFCRPGLEYLYRDYAHVNEWPSRDGASCYGMPGMHVHPASGDSRHAHVVEYGDRLSKESPFYTQQTFIKLGNAECVQDPVDVVIHARDRKVVRAHHNWHKDKYVEVAQKFTDAGYRVAFIGSQEQSFSPEGFRSLAGIDLESLCNYIAAAKIIVGPSSGPMHLAALCGCDQVVFCEGNRGRYREDWNPFRVRCEFPPGGWSPSVDDVYKEGLRVLENTEVFNKMKKQNMEASKKMKKQRTEKAKARVTPMIIINRDCLVWPRAMVEHMSAIPDLRIVILDNASTYPPLLEWYDTHPCEVFKNPSNSRSPAPWDTGLMNKLCYETGSDYIIISDSDLDLSMVPLDVVDKLLALFSIYGEDLRKAGLSLLINDLPNTEIAADAVSWESKFWRDSIIRYPDDQGGVVLPWPAFNAAIDTTFAMYRRGVAKAPNAMGSVRLAPPYCARHMPWYIDSPESLTDEYRYYIAHKSNLNNNWGTRVGAIYGKS